MARLTRSVRQAENDNFDKRVVDRLEESGFRYVDRRVERIAGCPLISTDEHDHWQ
jgi:hypothetical protein